MKYLIEANKEALAIIGNEAFKKMAEVQNISVEEVIEAINSGNDIATRQFNALVAEGIKVLNQIENEIKDKK